LQGKKEDAGPGSKIIGAFPVKKVYNKTSFEKGGFGKLTRGYGHLILNFVRAYVVHLRYYAAFEKENTMLEKFSVGENIVSYCTKCKLNLDHAIAALAGEAIAKVKCKTCGSAHKFRDPADVKKPRATRKKNDTVKTTEALWETCVAEAKGNESAYDMAGKYRVGDIVFHTTFGKGIVRKVYSNKCDVLFKDKERLMASTN
jgi:hypothetical protein